MPSFSFADLLDSTITAWSDYPALFFCFVATCLIVAYLFATKGWPHQETRSEMQDTAPLPYEPRSFSTPAPKGFARDHRGTVVSMQSRKRDGKDAA